MTVKLNAEAWADFDILVAGLLRGVASVLEREGSLYPVSVFLAGSKLRFQVLQPEAEVSTQSVGSLLAAYRHLLQATPSNTLACALAYDVTLKEADDGYHDAVQIELEHRTATRHTLLVPYRLVGSKVKIVELGPPQLKRSTGTEHLLYTG